MKHWIRLVGLTSLLVGATLAEAATSHAGQQLLGVDVDLQVYGPDAQGVLDGLTFEVYEETSPGVFEIVDPLTCTVPIPDVESDPFAAGETSACGLQTGDYSAGLAGVPAGWDVYVNCTDGSTPTAPPERLLDPAAEFSYLGGSSADCYIQVSSPTLLLDKVVVGGDASSSDFVLEVFDDQGALVNTASDVADATCDLDYDPASCAAIALAPGTDYQLGEEPVLGYRVTDVTCDQYINVNNPPNQEVELIPLGSATFDHDDGDTYCVVTNTYYESQVIVEKVVVNDSGRTAVASEFTAEVYRTTGATPVATGVCDGAGGECIDTMLPIGEYAIGETGPEGYTSSVACTIQREALEKIDSPSAVFDLEPFSVVTCVITNDDQPLPTTTTSTTTSTTTTTTTTLAPTTTRLDAGAGTLPATGTTSTTTTWMSIAALVLVGSGALLLIARRRPV